MKSYVVSADRPISASSNNQTGTICPGTTVKGCVYPKKPGGYLRIGSGDLANYSSGDPSQAGWKVTTNTAESICIELTQRTGACEAKFTATGTVTAVEQYPDIPAMPTP
jgi:hypothetical protein